MFREELQARKIAYFKAKEDKDKVFRELEQLKTQSRLLESRLKKKLSAKTGVEYPLKLEVALIKADLANNDEKVIGGNDEDTLEVYYKMDNGKEVFNSGTSHNIRYPTWDNLFNVEMQDCNERLYFQVFVIAGGPDGEERIVDTFDISAAIIEQNLKAEDEITDNISTASSNKFTLRIRGKVDVHPKLQNYRNKIAKNEQLLPKVEEPYKIARNKFEKFLNLKGVELLEEWGICGNDFKLVKKSKNTLDDNKHEKREASKILELNMDPHDRSYLNASMKTKKKRVSTAKKPERAVRHSITKTKTPVNPTPAVEVRLSDIGEVNKLDDDVKPFKRSESEEKIKERIEKKHLHKTYKTSAIIPEQDESPIRSPEVGVKDTLNQTQTLPAAQHSLKEEMDDKVGDLSGTQKLTASALNSRARGTKRMGLGSSLINFAMEDVSRTNQVKSVYNQNTKGSMGIGGMFKSMDISNTLSGMLMMNNGMGNQGMNNNNMNMDEDN